MNLRRNEVPWTSDSDMCIHNKAQKGDLIRNKVNAETQIFPKF